MESGLDPERPRHPSPGPSDSGAQERDLRPWGHQQVWGDLLELVGECGEAQHFTGYWQEVLGGYPADEEVQPVCRGHLKGPKMRVPKPGGTLWRQVK